MLIQHVAAGRGLAWVIEGFSLFRASPVTWMIATFLLVVALALLSLVPFFGSLAATLLQPVLVAGLLQGCRDLERGGELRIERLFCGFGAKAKPLMWVGLILGFASVVIMMILAGALFASGLFGSALIESADWADIMPQLINRTTLGVLLVLALGLLFSVPVAMAGWFAPALVMFDDLGAWDALKASYVGCLRNAWPFLIYGIVLLLTLFIALVPFALGLLIWLPAVFGSIYASYREVYASGP